MSALVQTVGEIAFENFQSAVYVHMYVQMEEISSTKFIIYFNFMQLENTG